MLISSSRALRPAAERPGGSVGRLRRHLLHVGIGAAALVLTATAAPTADATTPRILIGADGDASGLSRSIAAPLAYNGYGSLGGPVPVAAMVNMKSNTSWRTVANAASGSAVYNNIVRWATTIKSRPGTKLFAFHHEPESSSNTGFGTAGDYIAAYRRVVDIFRQQGVTNVEYTWQMTSWAFATSSSARNYAAKWYPGDSYVTDVGTDPYNWYDCGPGTGKWVDLKAVMDPSLAFARAHGKRVVVAEFASQSDLVRRPQWLRTVRQYFIANRATLRAVFYFQYIDPYKTGCHWKLSTVADLAAMREMAADTTNFTAS